jgi:hypothetical protein
MTAFRTKGLRKLIAALIANTAGELRLAVAYWGDGAIEQLALGDAPANSRRVLLSFLSGGSNPREVAKLEQIADVRHLTDLHAKVYIGDNDLFVGSANASDNGLLWTHGIGALHEAGIQSADNGLREDACRWFDALWQQARPISDADRKKAAEAWEARIHARAGARARAASVVSISSVPPAALQDRGIYVTWYLDTELTEKGEAQKKRHFKANSLASDEWDVFEGTKNRLEQECPEGGFLIKVWEHEGGFEVSPWFWEVVKPYAIEAISGTNRHIVVLRRHKQVSVPGVGMVRLTSADRRAISKMVVNLGPPPKRWKTIPVTQLFENHQGEQGKHRRIAGPPIGKKTG